jgi:ribosomal protein L18
MCGRDRGGSASSLEKDLGVVGKNNVEAAAKVGAAIAERAKAAGRRGVLLRPWRVPLSREVSRPWPMPPVKAA